MNARKVERSTELLGRALDRFGEILDRNDLDHDVHRDAAIQRFEFTYELFWKTLKARFEADGRGVGNSPRAVLRAAYQAGWFDDEAAVDAMLEDRNRTTHAYDETFADEVFVRLPRYHRVMRAVFDAAGGWA